MSAWQQYLDILLYRWMGCDSSCHTAVWGTYFDAQGNIKLNLARVHSANCQLIQRVLHDEKKTAGNCTQDHTKKVENNRRANRHTQPTRPHVDQSGGKERIQSVGTSQAGRARNR